MRLPIAVAVALLAGPAVTGCFDDLLGPSLPHAYLDGTYADWVVEIDHVQGERPASGSLNLLRDRIGALTKSSFTVQVDDSFGGDRTWTTSEIQALQRQRQDTQTQGDRVVTYVVFLDGEYEQANVAGVTIGYDLIAIFREAIDGACGLGSLCFGAEGEIEAAVLVHEFGHAIGLVDRGLEMQTDHEDDDHPGHSSNRNSVMWWQVESLGALGSLNNIPDTFDAHDRADVCAGGGRC